MWTLYNAAMNLFALALSIRALWHKETREWNRLRNLHLRHLDVIRKEAGDRTLVWMHCASLGEFEQGLPVLKMIRAQSDNCWLVVSFFSPSGYLQRKDTDHADAVVYLPIDTLSNARQAVGLLRPGLFIGVKYEFWWNLIRCLNAQHIPIVYLSVKLRENHYLLQTWAKKFREQMEKVKVIFTQDADTAGKLEACQMKNVEVAGDTRVASVLERKERAREIQSLEPLSSGYNKVMIYGSIYGSDLPCILPFLGNQDWFHIVVPHKTDSHTVASLTRHFDRPYHLWSQWDGQLEHGILVVDTVGWLFDLYAYATACYVGGGFERSVHNTLEPAVFGLPLAFGPKNKGFVETAHFLEKGIAREVTDAVEFADFAAKSDLTKNEIRAAITAYFEAHHHAMLRIRDWFLKYYFK